MQITASKLWGKPRKRIWQLLYLLTHLMGHLRTIRRLRTLQSGGNITTQFKYLGDYLALSMSVTDRLRVLVGHYEILNQQGPGLNRRLNDGVLLWERQVADDQPPLVITLERAHRTAPMEGELQLRFIFRKQLFRLTFVFGNAESFQLDGGTVLFIGGAQGGRNCREETREASKYNDEISPASMLIIAVRALAKAMRVDALIAIDEHHQIAGDYASERFKLPYRSLWIDAGGIQQDRYYYLPQDHVPKPLSEVPRPHRARTERKRAAKALIRSEIERRLAGLLG